MSVREERVQEALLFFFGSGVNWAKYSICKMFYIFLKQITKEESGQIYLKPVKKFGPKYLGSYLGPEPNMGFILDVCY